MQASALPPPVIDVLRRYQAVLEERELLAGLYVIGSAALGDFRPGRSDVDAVAVLARRPNRADRRALMLAQRAAPAGGGPSLDAVYVIAEELRRSPETTEPGWWTRRRRLRGPSMEMRNPVVWAELARHGVAIAGPPPAALGVRSDTAALAAYVRANIEDYWGRWAQRARVPAAFGLLRESGLAWGALGASRSHHTLATGEIVSKTAAGEAALQRFGETGRPVLERALAIRRGGEDGDGRVCAREAAGLLAFMATVTADARRLPPLAG